MKICLLSPASNVHTMRWANGLCRLGHEVHVISQHKPLDSYLPRVTLHIFPNKGILGYFLIAPRVKKLIARLQPDIVNAHYASGYGTTARMANVGKYVLSVWGSDVYDFPYQSPLHRYLLKKNLCSATLIASTSHCMARQVRRLVTPQRDIAITPFGIEMSAFSAHQPKQKNLREQSSIVIGTVKTMSHKYGIDTLIHAFAQLYQDLALSDKALADKLHLRLVGGGEQLEELEQLVQQLSLQDRVSFVGNVPHAQVPDELQKMDIFVALSRLDSESFGVAAVEACAAYLPVVVSDVDGFREVVLDEQTGLVVPRENPMAAANAIKRLILEDNLRTSLSSAGRQRVVEEYEWSHCLSLMEQAYRQVIAL